MQTIIAAIGIIIATNVYPAVRNYLDGHYSEWLRSPEPSRVAGPKGIYSSIAAPCINNISRQHGSLRRKTPQPPPVSNPKRNEFATGASLRWSAICADNRMNRFLFGAPGHFWILRASLLVICAAQRRLRRAAGAVSGRVPGCRFRW